METQPESATSNCFVNRPNFLSDPILAAAKVQEAGFAMWCGHCRQSRIRDLTPAAYSLSKFILKVIIYMVLTSKGRLGADIWPKARNQAKGVKDIMRRVWDTEVYYWQKASKTNSIVLSPSGKEARNVSLLISYNKTIMLLISA